MTEPRASTTDAEPAVIDPPADEGAAATASTAGVEGAPGARPPGAAPARSWVTATTVALAVVVLVLASAVAVLAFTTDDGAATPEDATRSMLDAVRRNDLIGIVESLPPGERRSLSDPIAKLTNELQRLRLIGATDPARVLGPEPVFADVELRTTALSQDITAVDLVSGSFSVKWPGDGPPLTANARQVLEKNWDVTVDPTGSEFSRDFARENLRLVTIKEGGGWHVSIAYTAAEALRGSGSPAPEMGKGPGSFGADLPETAVDDLVRAYADGHPERLVTLVSPVDGRAIYDYAPVFLPGATKAARRAEQDKTYEVQVNKLRTSVEGSGDTRRVRIVELDIDIRDELGKQHLWWSDGCYHTDRRVNDDDEPFAKTDSCSKDKPRTGDAIAPRDNPVSSLAIFGGGADLPTFTVIERDGRWFVSPVQTLLDSLLATMATLTDDDDVRGYAERLAATWDGGAGQGISGDLIRPTQEEVQADPSKAAERGRALAAGCAALATGDKAGSVTTACLRRLISLERVRAEDLPADARARLS